MRVSMKLILRLIILISPAVHALHFLVNPTGMYSNISAGSSEKVKSVYYDLRGGFYLGESFYVGGIYQNMSRDFQSLGSRERSSYGVSAGVFPMGGIYLLGHYYYKSTYQDLDKSTLSHGSGMQVDLGYLFSFSDAFKIGPQMTYRSFSYKEQTSNGVTTPSQINHYEFLPFLSAAFIY